jgi:putative nucleotidyltransferase with HDIG domain
MGDLAVAPLAQNGTATAKILIIDDESSILSVLYSLLSESYECKTATSAVEALEYLRQEEYDLVLSDIMMPGMSGLELLEEISRISRDTVVVLISGNLNIQSAIEAMRRGAFDYVTKPFNLSEVETAVQRALRHHLLLKANQQYEQHLEELVSVRTNELSLANVNLNLTLERLYMNYRSTLRALAAALEARDVETRGHSDRVVGYCLRLGKELGLAGRAMISLEHGALLHDIGKIGVPDAILLKKGSLSDEEWVHMRKHVEYGVQIVRGIDFLEGAAQVVGQHHERYDGSGYPRGLTADDICLGARIFAVADAVDAITSDRPYRKGRPFEAAFDELNKCASKHFDPLVVNTFISVPLDVWREIRELSVEPALVLPAGESGPALSYSRLSVDAERLTREWARTNTDSE